MIFTDPQVAAVGDGEGALTASVKLSEVARTSTYSGPMSRNRGSSHSCRTASG